MKQFIVLIFCIASLTAQSQPLVWPWAEALGGRAQIDSEIDMAVDSEGNVILVGNFEGMRDFGSYSLTAVGNSDAYICKLDSNANVLWAVRGGDPMVFADANGVTVDANDNIYVVGRYAGSLTFDTTTIAGIGNRDIFIAKFSPAGEIEWLISEGGTNLDAAYDINCDLSNNALYVTGSFLENADFGSFNLTSSGINDEDIFLARYNTDGVVQWAISEGGNQGDRGLNIKIDVDHNVYLSGYFSATAIFDAGTLVSAGSVDMFVAKYNQMGVGQWVRGGGGPGTDTGEGVGVDKDGNVYVSGVFTATANFGGINITEPNSIGAMYIAKYNSNGVIEWVRKGQCNSPAQVKGLALDTDENGFSYVTGFIGANAVFSGQNAISSGGEDVFIAKYSTYGKLMWITTCGGTFNDRGLIIKADQNGTCTFGGIFIQNASFGPHNLSAPLPTYKHFISKIRGQNVGVGKDEIKHGPANFILFPNPASGELSFNYLLEKNPGILELKIYSAAGQLMLQESTAHVNGSLNISELPAGNYLFEIINGSNSDTSVFTKM